LHLPIASPKYVFLPRVDADADRINPLQMVGITRAIKSSQLHKVRETLEVVAPEDFFWLWGQIGRANAKDTIIGLPAHGSSSCEFYMQTKKVNYGFFTHKVGDSSIRFRKDVSRMLRAYHLDSQKSSKEQVLVVCCSNFGRRIQPIVGSNPLILRPGNYYIINDIPALLDINANTLYCHGIKIELEQTQANHFLHVQIKDEDKKQVSRVCFFAVKNPSQQDTVKRLFGDKPLTCYAYFRFWLDSVKMVLLPVDMASKIHQPFYPPPNGEEANWPKLPDYNNVLRWLRSMTVEPTDTQEEGGPSSDRKRKAEDIPRGDEEHEFKKPKLKNSEAK